VVTDTKSIVRSLAKGFRILEAFDPEEAEMTLSHIAERAQLDVGTTFRLVNTLVMLGYLQQVKGKRYRLGFKVLDLGFTSIARMDLPKSARPLLRSLLEENLVDSANIDVLDGSDLIRIERIQRGLQKPGLDQRLGSRVPVLDTPVGQVILAHLPKAHWLRLNIQNGMNGRTAVYDLGQNLESVKKQGYAYREPFSNGGKGLVVTPVLDVEGFPNAALSVTTSEREFSKEAFLDRIARRVVQTARDLERIWRISGSTYLSRAGSIQKER